MTRSQPLLAKSWLLIFPGIPLAGGVIGLFAGPEHGLQAVIYPVLAFLIIQAAGFATQAVTVRQWLRIPLCILAGAGFLTGWALHNWITAITGSAGIVLFASYVICHVPPSSLLRHLGPMAWVHVALRAGILILPMFSLLSAWVIFTCYPILEWSSWVVVLVVALVTPGVIVATVLTERHLRARLSTHDPGVLTTSHDDPDGSPKFIPPAS
jgi:hypothetical protein